MEEHIKIDKKTGLLLEDVKMQNVKFGEPSSRRNLQEKPVEGQEIEDFEEEMSEDQKKEIEFWAYLRSTFTFVSEEEYSEDDYEGMFDYLKNQEALEMTKEDVFGRMKAEQEPDYMKQEEMEVGEEDEEEMEGMEDFDGETELEEKDNGRRNLGQVF